MTRALLPLLLLSACGPSTIQLADDTAGLGGDDTAGGDTDTASDTDIEDTDTEPVYVPDFSVWESTRRFYYDYSEYGVECDETITDSGEAVDEGSSDYEALAEVCGDCTYFYEVTPSQDEVCGWIGLGQTWRGVVIDGEDAEVYFLRENDGGVEEYGGDDAATFDGQNIDWAYEYESYGGAIIEVSGTATYPLILQE